MQKKKEKKIEEKNLINLYWSSIRALIWKASEISLGYLIYVKIFVKFCFLYGYFYKEL